MITENFHKPVQNNRVRTGKKPGAQKGHKGTTLKMVDHPDHIITHHVEGFCSCGCNLDDLPISSSDTVWEPVSFPLPTG